jgi:cytochrome c oxidase assembly protein subunit 15
VTESIEQYQQEQVARFYRPWVHYVALLTPYVAMFTILMGALTTTKNAGMAFRDWPSSDGQNMITYPIFNLLGDITTNRESLDKFLEHSHRLAGILIGIVSIVLAGLCRMQEKRSNIYRYAGIIIMLCVIVQGLLGGFRVYLDARGLAMIHGLFAAFVFALMCGLALSTSKRWIALSPQDVAVPTKAVYVMGMISVHVLALQYILGGLLRHKGILMYEHLGIGFIALIVVFATAIVALCSDSGWIRRGGLYLLLTILLQFALGWGAFITKYGLPSMGYVAEIDSIQQVIFRTAHMIGGVLLMTASILLLMRIRRVKNLRPEYTTRFMNTIHIAQSEVIPAANQT